jgi:hypothetical protein
MIGLKPINFLSLLSSALKGGAMSTSKRAMCNFKEGKYTVIAHFLRGLLGQCQLQRGPMCNFKEG